MLCSIGWVFHGVPFDGLEIEERNLSVSRNGRLSGYIYSLGEAPSNNYYGLFGSFEREESRGE